jgi:hypothetical protein
VRHHGERDVVEEGLLDEVHFPAGGLLRRGAQDLHRNIELLCDVGERQRSPHRGGCVHVVPAGVADAGQAVVLHAERHDELPAAPASAERGGQ